MSRFKDERERLGYGQSELAEKIDVTRRTMSRWENEDDAPIPSDKLSLCANLGFDVQYVITGKKQSKVESVYTEEVIVKATRGMLYDAAMIKAIQIADKEAYDLLIRLMVYNLKKAVEMEGAELVDEKVAAKAAGVG